MRMKFPHALQKRASVAKTDLSLIDVGLSIPASFSGKGLNKVLKE